MASLKNLLLSTATLALVAIAPMTAHAISVDCELKDGSSCTVSNDPSDSVSCACSDESGTASSGADEWADFDEEMLLEICVAELEACSFVDTDGGTDSATTTTAGTFGTGSSTGDYEGTSTGYVGTSGYGTTGGGDTTGDDETASGSGPSTDPAETTGSSATNGGDDSGSPDPTAGGESGGSDGSSSGGAEEDSEDPSGCSVGTDHPGGALMALFGLVLGYRRRR